MTPVKTIEARNRKNSHHLQPLDPIPEFCDQCGQALLVQIEQGFEFSRRTGRRMLASYVICPSRPSHPLAWLTSHIKQGIRLDQDEAYELLYQFVVEASVNQ